MKYIKIKFIICLTVTGVMNLASSIATAGTTVYVDPSTLIGRTVIDQTFNGTKATDSNSQILPSNFTQQANAARKWLADNCGWGILACARNPNNINKCLNGSYAAICEASCGQIVFDSNDSDYNNAIRTAITACKNIANGHTCNVTSIYIPKNSNNTMDCDFDNCNADSWSSNSCPSGTAKNSGSNSK